MQEDKKNLQEYYITLVATIGSIVLPVLILSFYVIAHYSTDLTEYFALIANTLSASTAMLVFGFILGAVSFARLRGRKRWATSILIVPYIGLLFICAYLWYDLLYVSSNFDDYMSANLVGLVWVALAIGLVVSATGVIISKITRRQHSDDE